MSGYIADCPYCKGHDGTPHEKYCPYWNEEDGTLEKTGPDCPPHDLKPAKDGGFWCVKCGGFIESK